MRKITGRDVKFVGLSLIGLAIIIFPLFSIVLHYKNKSNQKKFTLIQDDRVYHSDKPVPTPGGCVAITDASQTIILCGCYTVIVNDQE